MNKFTVSILLATCLIANVQSFVLKEPIQPIGKFIETKKDLFDSASTVIGNLKHSAVVKGKALISNVKAVANAKLAVINNIKNAKLGLIKSALEKKYSTIAAVKAATQAFVKTAVNVGKEKVVNAASAVSAKTKGLYQHKVALKENAITFASGVINNGIEKKKALVSSIKSIKAPKSAVGYVNYKDKYAPYKLHTYTSNEAPVVGKVFVQSQAVAHAQAQVVNDKPPVASNVGLPANTYGPPAETYGSPANV